MLDNKYSKEHQVPVEYIPGNHPLKDIANCIHNERLVMTGRGTLSNTTYT